MVWEWTVPVTDHTLKICEVMPVKGDAEEGRG